MSSSLADGLMCSQRRVAKIHLSISSLTHLYRYCLKLQVCVVVFFIALRHWFIMVLIKLSVATRWAAIL